MIGAWKDLVDMQSLPTSGTFRCAAARRAPGVFEGKVALWEGSRRWRREGGSVGRFQTLEKGRWLMSSSGSFSSAIAYTNGILPGADHQQPSRRCMLWKVAGGVSFHDACNHDMPGRLLAVAFADVLAPGTTLGRPESMVCFA